MIRILVCDDNPIVRQGLVAVLSTFDDLWVVGEAEDGRQAREQFERLRPDVVLLDVRMPRTDGLEALNAIVAEAQVLMLTYSDEPDTVTAALRAGASGYLVHGEQDPPQLASAIRTVAEGGTVLGRTASAAAAAALRTAPPHLDIGAAFGLTRREAEVMELLAGGRANAEIADEMYLTVKTVKNHLYNCYVKLGVGTRSAAVALWLRGPTP